MSKIRRKKEIIGKEIENERRKDCSYSMYMVSPTICLFRMGSWLREGKK